MSSTRTPWHDRGWMNATGPSAPRRGAESMSSRPSISRRTSVSARFADLEADVVEALALVRQEAGDAGRVVGRLDEFDLRLADGQEGDADPVVLDVHDRLERGAERVAPEAEGGLDGGDDERDVVDLAQRPDGLGNGWHGSLLRAGYRPGHDDQGAVAGCRPLFGHGGDDRAEGRAVVARQAAGLVPRDDDRAGADGAGIAQDLLEGVPVAAGVGGQGQPGVELVEELGLRRRAGQLGEAAAVLVGGRGQSAGVRRDRQLDEAAGTLGREHRVEVGVHGAIHRNES